MARIVTPSDMTGRLLAGCDAEQREAITTPARPLCVLAAAGSGKTRVLTRRIAWRVNEGSASAPYVLALTFTRKAASELRGRLSSLGLAEEATAGTFHAVAFGELRRLAAERQRPAPVVIASKARLLAAAAGHDVAHDRTALADLAAEIEWAQARCLSARDYTRAVTAGGRRSQSDPEVVTEVWKRYEREKRRRGVLDFEDLLVRCASELEDDPDFAASARWRLRHLFVDEYQDVNPAQVRLLDAWLGDSDDLCVVGDPDQAIYSWNGSDPRALVEFPLRYPGARVVRLAMNYRSTDTVLAVASSVLGAATVPAGPAPPARGHQAGEPGRELGEVSFRGDHVRAERYNPSSPMTPISMRRGASSPPSDEPGVQVRRGPASPSWLVPTPSSWRSNASSTKRTSPSAAGAAARSSRARVFAAPWTA